MPKERENDVSEDMFETGSETDPQKTEPAVNEGKQSVVSFDVALQHLRILLRLEQIGAFLASREPRLWPTLWAMLGVAILLSLGTWQVLRSAEKNALIAQVQENLVAAPVDLGLHMPETAEEWNDLHYKPVRLAGRWMTLRDFRLAPRSFAEQIGYQWLIPFRLENGRIIMVNRGFVPQNMVLVPPDDGEIQEIHGVAYVPKADKPRFIPDNLPLKGEWIWMDLAAMAHEIGVKNMAPAVVYESRISDKNTYPIGGQLPLPFHNRHWHYAVTWYCLALSLMGVWLLASGAKPVENNAKDGEEDADDEHEEMDPVARRGLYPEATD